MGTRERRDAALGAAGAMAGEERRRNNWLLLGGLLLTLVLWNVPYGAYPLYPFRLFATWLHEGSHALAMWVTGAGVDSIQVFPDGSGLAHSEGGTGRLSLALIASAGYLGTALFGALLLLASRSRRGAQAVLLGTGVLMLLSSVFPLSNLFGRLSILGVGLGLLAAGRFAGEGARLFLANFLAAQACVNAVLDIRVLFAAHMMVNGRPARGSDAHLMSEVVGLPYWLWASLWMGVSVALLWAALRRGRLGKG